MSESTRPQLNSAISAADFRAFYWLKQELLDFCRANGLSTVGSKSEISGRIESFLSSRPTDKPNPRISQAGQVMPAQLSRQTVIQSGFRCTQQLRAFLVQEIGKHFHFDTTMRDFIKNGVGHTLGEAIAAWQYAQDNPTPKEIAPQFEYNRHIREFFNANPGATLSQAIVAWREKRSQRR